MDFNIILDEFYKENKDLQFLNKKDLAVICKAPFSFAVDKMKAGESVRLKYLGNIQLSMGRLYHIFKYYLDKYKEGALTKEYIDNYIANLSYDIKNTPEIKELIDNYNVGK